MISQVHDAKIQGEEQALFPGEEQQMATPIEVRSKQTPASLMDTGAVIHT